MKYTGELYTSLIERLFEIDKELFWKDDSPEMSDEVLQLKIERENILNSLKEFSKRC